MLIEELIKKLNLEDINYEIFYSNSQLPYFVNELSGYELTASNVKRVINMLDEQDKKQLLNIMKVEDIDKLKDEDFI